MFLEGSPGERVSQELIIKNQTRLDVVLHPALFDMQAGPGSSTALDYVPPGEAPRGAADWVRALELDEIGMEAVTQHAVDVVVDIPADAGAGGHYAAIVFTIPDPRPGAQFPIEATAPVPIFITVRGAYERDLRASLVPTDRWRWRGGLGTWRVELENAGDVHEVVAGRVRVDGVLGGATSKPIRQGILLPGERRTQRLSFDVRDAPDLLGAELRVERDDGDPRRDDARSVVVLPWWLLVLVALAAVVVTWRIRARARRDGHDREDDEGEGSWDPSPPAG